jgi:hypothetical protein
MCYLCSRLTASGFDGAGGNSRWGNEQSKPGDRPTADELPDDIGFSFIPSIVTQVSLTGNDLLDALIWGWKWAYPNWSYSFPQEPSDYFYPAPGQEDGFPGYGYGSIIGFRGFNDQQQAQIASVINNVENFLPVTFLASEMVTDEDFGEGEFFVDFRFAIADAISYGFGTNGVGEEFTLHGPGGGGSAEASVPDPFIMNWRTMGDTWFITDVYDAPVPGSFSTAAGLMHEFGHVLGLKHGHHPQFLLSMGEAYVDENGLLFAKPDYVGDAPALPYEYDSQEYSIMTYRTYVGSNPFEREERDLPSDLTDYPWTFMMLDVATLQHLYGANFAEGSNPGDTTYRFDPETGQMTIIDSVDGEQVTAPSLRSKVFLTIWDGGGKDTYDFSNYVEDMHIDLRPGQWITFSQSQLAQLGDGIYAKGNIANALLYEDDPRSLIDNVIAGVGDHVIIGNDADNHIYANVGNSRIYASAGNDMIDGGEGQNTVVYWDERKTFEIALSEETISVAKPNGQDLLVEIGRVEFTDGALLFDLQGLYVGFAYRLYEAVFGRTPDEGGLRFWNDLLENDLTSPLSVGLNFIMSEEFVTRYGSNLSDDEYLEALYLNALNRQSDEEGLAYWKGAMQGGLDKVEVLLHFSESAENVAQTEGDLSTGVWVV